MLNPTQTDTAPLPQPDAVPEPPSANVSASDIQNALNAKITKEQSREFFTEFRPKIKRALEDRKDRATTINTLHLYEQGMIGKPRKDFPFKGSADYRPQTSLQYERQIIPDFVGAVWDAERIVRYVGGGVSDGKQECFNDYEFRHNIPHFWDTLNGAAWRYVGPEGNCVIKVTYDQTYRSQTVAEQVDENLRLMIQQIDKLNKKSGAPDDTLVKIIALAHDWNTETDLGKKRAEDFLAQVRDPVNDVVKAIVQRACGSPIKVSFIDNDNNFVQPVEGLHIQTQPWLAEWSHYDPRELRDEVRKGRFNKANVEAILEKKTSTQSSDGETVREADAGLRDDDAQEMQEFRNIVQGLAQNITLGEGAQVWEIHCWRKRSWLAKMNGLSDDDDTEVRAVINFCPLADPDVAVLRAMEHPNDLDGLFNWPFVQMRFNDARRGVNCGQGVPQLNNTIEQEQILQVNTRIDMLTLATCFTEYMSNQSFAGQPPINKPRVPGQRIGVDGDPRLATYIPEHPDFSTAHALLNNNLQQQSKELIGIPDIAQMPQGNRPPTKFQTQAFIQPRAGILQHEIKNWLNGWSDVFKMCHALNRQYRFVGNTQGKLSFINESASAPDYISKDDYAPRFIIRAGGDVNRMDAAQEAQKLVAFTQLYGNNPAYAPLINAWEMFQLSAHRLLGPIAAQKIINSQATADAFQKLFMQYQAQAMAASETNAKKREGGAGGAPAQMPGDNLGNFPAQGAV